MYVSSQNDHVHHGILINSLGKTPQYVQFLCIHQEVTQVVFQHVVVRMLTKHVMPVPPHLSIVLLLKPNPIKEAGHSSVSGHGG